ncbi:hypothetical protein CVS27_20115 [Arthrobacter glacialis]|uniref:Uncharacterized protein n=1 Tax=Arthrobacter glacialis TaxID=1664 RepID=A0A2S3ZQW2_ARTGL|nr:hypothetical protein CVS27_20115 [Arthrobacter glacialis]
MPDYFVRQAEGTGVVIDARTDALVKPADEDVFGATAQLCASVGWSYERLGELKSNSGANLRWIAGYRHPRCDREEFTCAILVRLNAAGSESIRELACAIGDPICVLPTVFHLIWRHQITTDLLGYPCTLRALSTRSRHDEQRQHSNVHRRSCFLPRRDLQPLRN